MYEKLLERKAFIEKAFEERKAEKSKLQEQSNEVDTELVKLQGEFRLITELIEDAEPKTKDTTEDANTITVEEPEE